MDGYPSERWSRRECPSRINTPFRVDQRLANQTLERGEPELPDKQLFDRAVFKEALKEVSKVRYNQTMVAEYPDLKIYMDRLEGQKAEQSLQSLQTLWQVTKETANEAAERLVSVGFFEKRDRKGTTSYWIPFIYRGALKLVQGRA